MVDKKVGLFGRTGGAVRPPKCVRTDVHASIPRALVVGLVAGVTHEVRVDVCAPSVALMYANFTPLAASEVQSMP